MKSDEIWVVVSQESQILRLECIKIDFGWGRGRGEEKGERKQGREGGEGR